MVSIFSTTCAADNMHLSKTTYRPTCSLLLDDRSKIMNKNTYFSKLKVNVLDDRSKINKLL